MEKLFNIINPAYSFIISILFILLFIKSLNKYKCSKDNLFLILSVICFGLFYDTFITSLGYVLVKYEFIFSILGIMRHVFHALLTPLVLLFVFITFKSFNLFNKKIYNYIVLLIILFFSISSIIAVFTSNVELIDYASVIRHSIDKENTTLFNKFMFSSLSYGTLIPMSLGAIICIKYGKDYNQLYATISMFLFTIIGVIFESRVIFLTSFIGELLLVYFYYKYIKWYLYEKH